MRIGIITVYEPITNLGSYLQAFALKNILGELGHEVYIIQNRNRWQILANQLFRIRPKREFLLRFLKGYYFLSDIKKLNLVDKTDLCLLNLDCLIYGSDEIWNLDNPYFQNDLFWGINIPSKIRQIAYAVSMGTMSENNFRNNKRYVESVKKFEYLFPRDKNTREILEKCLGKKFDIVCDPTLLIDVSLLSHSISVPKQKYLLVYTYGVSPYMESLIKQYARKYGLLIVSPCFWHHWVDKVIECSALQFSTLIAHAECVFTTTFHGAIFTMLNHKPNCILPMREKVRDIVIRLGETQHLINDSISFDEFERIMKIPYDSTDFDTRVSQFRDYSLKMLVNSIIK